MLTRLLLFISVSCLYHNSFFNRHKISFRLFAGRTPLSRNLAGLGLAPILIMPKFRMNRKNREERQLHHVDSAEFCMSPRAPPTPPKSIDLPPFSRLRSPHDSAQDLSERIHAWNLTTSEGATESHPHLSRKASMRTEHMIRSPQPPNPTDVLVVGAGPAGLMLA